MTYLSIDIDFWEDAAKALAFLGKIHLPIHCVAFHDQLLPHIERSGCSNIHNVDFHSDLSDLYRGQRDALTEGTWASFPSCKYRGKFVWHYPSKTRIKDGYCHGRVNPFEDGEHGGWCEVRMEQGLRLPWHSVKTVGLCVSPDWVLRKVAEPVIERLRLPKEWLSLKYRDKCFPAPIVSSCT